MTTSAPVPQHQCPKCGRWAWRHVKTVQDDYGVVVDIAECTVCKTRLNRRADADARSDAENLEMLRRYPGKIGDDF